jgi:hypothetical protein
MKAVIARIASPDCDYLSVKISAIFSQIHLVAHEETLAKLKDRLRRLYRAAIAHPVPDGKGGSRAKFINLDMEEYRDLSLTRDVFRPGARRAGIHETRGRHRAPGLPAGCVAGAGRAQRVGEATAWHAAARASRSAW